MKLNEVRCPGMIAKMAAVPSDIGALYARPIEESCGSYEISFGTPIYKDRECDEVIIDAVCDSCGHQFQVHGHVVATKIE